MSETTAFIPGLIADLPVIVGHTPQNCVAVFTLSLQSLGSPKLHRDQLDFSAHVHQARLFSLADTNAVAHWSMSAYHDILNQRSGTITDNLRQDSSVMLLSDTLYAYVIIADADHDDDAREMTDLIYNLYDHYTIPIIAGLWHTTDIATGEPVQCIYSAFEGIDESDNISFIPQVRYPTVKVTTASDITLDNQANMRASYQDLQTETVKPLILDTDLSDTPTAQPAPKALTTPQRDAFYSLLGPALSPLGKTFEKALYYHITTAYTNDADLLVQPVSLHRHEIEDNNEVEYLDDNPAFIQLVDLVSSHITTHLDDIAHRDTPELDLSLPKDQKFISHLMLYASHHCEPLMLSYITTLLSAHSHGIAAATALAHTSRLSLLNSHPQLNPQDFYTYQMLCVTTVIAKHYLNYDATSHRWSINTENAGDTELLIQDKELLDQALSARFDSHEPKPYEVPHITRMLYHCINNYNHNGLKVLCQNFNIITKARLGCIKHDDTVEN